MPDQPTTPEAFDPISRVQNLAVRLIGAQDDPENYAPCGGLVKQLGRHPSMSVSGLNAALMAAERMVGVIESDINQHGVEAVLDALDSAVRLTVLARDVYQATTTAEGT